MAENEKGQAGKGAEGGEGKTPEAKNQEPKGGEITQQRLDAEVSRRHKAEEELEKLRKGQEEQKTKALEEQNKFKELYEGVKTKATLAEEMEKSIGEYFAEEISDLADEQKALIPEGAAHTRLAWVKKAKKAGIFGKTPNPEKTFNGKPRNGVPPEKWYLDIKSDDPKFNSLTPAQFTEWKAHNRPQVAAGLTGRGGF